MLLSNILGEVISKSCNRVKCSLLDLDLWVFQQTQHHWQDLVQLGVDEIWCALHGVSQSEESRTSVPGVRVVDVLPKSMQ